MLIADEYGEATVVWAQAILQDDARCGWPILTLLRDPALIRAMEELPDLTKSDVLENLPIPGSTRRPGPVSDFIRVWQQERERDWLVRPDRHPFAWRPPVRWLAPIVKRVVEAHYGTKTRRVDDDIICEISAPDGLDRFISGVRVRGRPFHLDQAVVVRSTAGVPVIREASLPALLGLGTGWYLKDLDEGEAQDATRSVLECADILFDRFASEVLLAPVGLKRKPEDRRVRDDAAAQHDDED